jgi:hypothetical protein
MITSKTWEQRRARWGAWKALQKDFTKPACLRCGHRFEPEHIGQDVCSTRCFRILVLKGMITHRKNMAAFTQKGA